MNIIKSALRGDEYDFTTINLRKAVILLAIPMMLELALESVFAVVDIFFVNKLGVHAVSIVGLTESVITIVYSVGIGLSAAATAMVARRVGEKDNEGAAHAGAQAIVLAFLASIVLGIPGFLYAENILKVMGAEPEAIRQGLTYTRIMLAGNVAIILLFLINGVHCHEKPVDRQCVQYYPGSPAYFRVCIHPCFGGKGCRYRHHYWQEHRGYIPALPPLEIERHTKNKAAPL
jgi:Na+-driven multidrug efflux pump